MKSFSLSLLSFSRRLFLILVSVFAFQQNSGALPYHQLSPLSALIGTEAYDYLNPLLKSEEWSYLELIALRVSILEELALQGNFETPWEDSTFVRQNNLLNILQEIAPLAKEAYLTRGFLNDSDPELRTMAEDEMVPLNENLYSDLQRLRQALWDIAVPEVAGDVMIEITPPENRPESSLAIGTMATFYGNLARANGWTYELVSSKVADTSWGIVLEGSTPLSHAFIKISGPDVFRKIFLESGVHRIIFTDDNFLQNVLAKGSNTRTNYAQVRVYATPRPSAFVFRNTDVEFQFVRSSGPGGQHVNKTASAVWAKHIPSGISVFVQESRDQHRNRRIALEMIIAKLFTQYLEVQEKELFQIRQQVDNGRIFTDNPYVRTYNLYRNPVQDYAILRGQVTPESFNGWEDLLMHHLEKISRELILEIQRLNLQLPNQHSNLLSVIGEFQSSNSCSEFLSEN